MKTDIKFIQDWETREFHITPVLTLTWYSNFGWRGVGLGLEWGVWAIVILVVKRPQYCFKCGKHQRHDCPYLDEICPASEKFNP